MASVRAGSRGVLTSVLSCSVFVAPCAFFYARFVWPFLGLWVAFAGVRWQLEDEEVLRDGMMFGVLSVAFMNRSLIMCVAKTWQELDFWEHVAQESTIMFFSGILISLALPGIALYQNVKLWTQDRRSSRELPEDVEAFKIPSHLKSLILPCRTTHARIFPKRYAFGYSYLICGFPIIPASTTMNEIDISLVEDRWKGKWWMQIRAEDYLFRGHGELGFYNKLKITLKDQGVGVDEWLYAYLVTAPRFLGYSFNPVSFWYIYDHAHKLKKMVLEVNNTFGERRIYVLDGSSPSTPSNESDNGSSRKKLNKDDFADEWIKDFHVSPFNSRKGTYTLKTLNPFPSPTLPSPKIDNTITLKSSKDHAKLVARIYSTEAPLDPAGLGIRGTVRFILRWWWVGFMTFPRILKEAFHLFFTRRLHIWFRPEVLSSSISRTPTSTEAELQEIFQSYLNYTIETSLDQWNITYHTSIPRRPQALLAPTHVPGQPIHPKQLEFRVLTPAFYSRFVHYRHTSEALDRECLFTDEKNRTVCISNPKFLSQLLSRRKPPSSEDHTPSMTLGYLDKLRWTMLRKLRCPPAAPSYSINPKPVDSFRVNDIRALPFSDLDNFVRSFRGGIFAAKYRRAVTKLFLAQRLTLGFPEVITMIDMLLRLVMSYFGVQMLIQWAKEAANHGLGQYLELPPPGSCVAELRGATLEWYRLCGVAFWASSCHLYGLLKGYR